MEKEPDTPVENQDDAVKVGEIKTTGGDVVVNKQHGEWTEKQKNKMEAALKNQDIHLVEEEDGQTKEFTKTELKNKTSLYLKNCKNGEYTTSVTCAKLFVQGCSDCKIILNGRLKTSTIEAWSCNNVVFQINQVAKTFQLDLSSNIEINYKEKKNFFQLIWGGVQRLTLNIGEGDELVSETTGFDQMKELYGDDLSDTTDQFIVRFIDDKLTTEQIVRLKNGYPTTEREADEYDARQAKNDAEMEAYVRKLVKFAAPKLGITDARKRPKIGRNKPCPCGSDQKFKKCCWDKYEDNPE
eukprot:CAMPEP_0174269286 /NCGR_PEP_ID=MMETSP0439-20130205/40495_1 /TAXON_ID=0 /ORGANISM="Stereomyxa ramosa, Strain Chinc5" /LENGTH=296 /DNA_ID=CAMNT_0015357979 /DNA_START=86 /DNA_END=976 /DNA_ORIENTATION=+